MNSAFNRKLNLGAALLHFVQAVIVIAVIIHFQDQPVRGVYPVFKVVPKWSKYNATAPKSEWSEVVKSMNGNFTVDLKLKVAGDAKVDVRYAIFTFFVLSAIFQFLASFVTNQSPANFDLYSERLRYVEYSVSAAVMIICIGIESGVASVHTLLAMFVLTFATMIFGLLADLLSEFSVQCRHLFEQGSPYYDPAISFFGAWLWLIPHLAGWVTCIVAYVPILDTYLSAVAESDVKAPDFVNVIVFQQFGLFLCFGFVQSYALVSRTWVNDRNDPQLIKIRAYASRAFIVLSFVAKTLLAWLVLSPIIVSYSRNDSGS